MFKIKTLILAGSVLLLSEPFAIGQTAPVSANAIAPYAAPTGFTVQSTSHYANGRLAQLYPTSPAANWYFAMMGEPIDPVENTPSQWYSPLYNVEFHSWSWSVPWGEVTALQSPGGWSENLQYKGENAACTTPSGAADEHDEAIGPNVNSIATQYGSSKNFPTLDKFTSINISGQMNIVSFSKSAGTACTNSSLHVGMQLIAILTDAKANQMIWYQLQLGCLTLSGNSCVIHAPVEFWLGKNHMTGPTANYAETDGLSNLGLNTLTAPGALVFNNMNILPRLIALVTGGISGIDTNLANWKMDGISLEDQHWNKVDATVGYKGFFSILDCKNPINITF